MTTAGAIEWTYAPGGEIARALRYGLDHPGLAALGLVETAVGDVAAAGVRLGQNQPNPFNPRTTISYDLPAAAPVRLAVYDARGRQVAVLADGLVPAGSHSLVFDASDLASGVYVYRLQAGNDVLTRQLTVLK